MFDGEQTAGAGESESAKADAENQKQESGKAETAKTDDTGTDDAIKKELRARANKLQEERDALLKEKQDREAAEQKRKEKEAAEAGKFEELAATRERERDEAKNEATSLKAENDQLRQAIDDALKATVATLPEPIKDILNDTFEEADVLGRYAWLQKPSVQKQITDATKEPSRGNGGDPKSRGSNDRQSVAAEKRALLSRGGYGL